MLNNKPITKNATEFLRLTMAKCQINQAIRLVAILLPWINISPNIDR